MKVRIPKTTKHNRTEYLGPHEHDLEDHIAAALVELGLAEYTEKKVKKPHKRSRKASK